MQFIYSGAELRITPPYRSVLPNGESTVVREECSGKQIYRPCSAKTH